MKLPDANGAGTLGARKIPMSFQNDAFTNPKIQTETGFNMGGFGDSFNNFAGNPAMRNLAGNIIKDQVSKQTEGLASYFSFDIIRPYFHVDNSYILKKLKLIFLPVIQKGDWKSTGAEDIMGSNVDFDVYKPHSDNVDPFGVDLYLPLMSLITLSLIVGFYQGAMGEFDPAFLGYLVTKICFIWLVESTIIKVMFVISGVQHSPFMELF